MPRRRDRKSWKSSAMNPAPESAISELPLPPRETLPATVAAEPTPWSWRFAVGGALAVVVIAAYAGESLGARFRSGCGVLAFLGLVALFSSNLRLVNWR